MAIKDYMVIDIAKPVNTYANLTDYFQGRVGDAEAYCKLWIKFGTRPIDMTGKKLRFEGNDPNNTPFIDCGRFDAGDDGDPQHGMVTFYFPQGIFQVEGKWQNAFFKLQDQNGSDISSINLELKVLPNNVEMGITIHPFQPDLERVKAQINQALREMNAQQLLNQIESMKTTVGAYTDLITRNQVLNKPDTIKLINDTMATEAAKLDSKMNALSTQVTSSIRQVQADMDKSAWHYKSLAATVINGAGGWGVCNLAYNDTIYIATYSAWIHVPGNNVFIDFMTNPLSAYVDFTNHTFFTTVMLTGSTEAGGKGYGRVLAGVQLDGNNGGNIGLYSGNDANGNTIYSGSEYGFLLNFNLVGPRGELHGV